MDTTALRPGDDIAPGLRAVRLLGGGLRYEVHLAHSDHLRALVVVKVLRQGLGSDALAAMHGERRLLDRLAHPMLLRGLGGDLDAPRPHLVLELIEGPRLSTLIRKHGVDLEQRLPLALNLTSVLHYLAQEGVAHLDVKPSNVIMGAAPRLIDLSVARPVGELPALTRPVGTAAYMAPEQRDPARFGELGPATDVWGLGATLLEAIERRRPLDEHGRPIPLGRHLPAPVRDAVAAALDPRPEARPTAAELGDALEPLVGALPAPRIGRFRPRRRTHHHNPKEVRR
jgi:serine/threonine-protein kinase